MSDSLAVAYNENDISDHNIPTYSVNIFKNEDGHGYWAKCTIYDGCAYTDGDTIFETQSNMYESVSLFLQDDYPNIKDFSLRFITSNE